MLLNRPEIDVGDELRNLKSFCADMSFKDRGWAIGNSDMIRMAHNSFSRQEPFQIEEDRRATKEDDVFHFISYLPFNDVLYELDGLQEGPIFLDVCTEEDWLQKAREEITQRIQKYAANEIRFNLLAIVADPRERAEREKSKLRAVGSHLRKALGVAAPGEEEKEAGVLSEEEVAALPSDSEGMQKRLAELDEETAELDAVIAIQNEKREKWRVENNRRRHNYVPFIFETLKVLAEKNMLEGMYGAAVEKRQKEKERKEKADKEKMEAEKPH